MIQVDGYNNKSLTAIVHNIKIKYVTNGEEHFLGAVQSLGFDRNKSGANVHITRTLYDFSLEDIFPLDDTSGVSLIIEDHNICKRYVLNNLTVTNLHTTYSVMNKVNDEVNDEDGKEIFKSTFDSVINEHMSLSAGNVKSTNFSNLDKLKCVALDALNAINAMSKLSIFDSINKPMQSNELNFVTLEEALEKVKSLELDGYEAIPADEPLVGIKGWIVFKEINDEELCINVRVPVYGNSLILEEGPDFVSGIDILDFMSQENVHRADRPAQLRFGFVKYVPEEGKSLYRSVNIVKLKKFKDIDLVKDIFKI